METFVEGFAEVPVGASRDTIVTVRGGATWEYREGAFVGGGIGPAFGPDSPDLVVTAGLTWAF